MSSVDSPPSGLRRQAGSGVRWGLGASVAIQASTVVSTIATTRLLSPTDVALVAAATIAATFCSVFAQAGFGVSLMVGDRDDDVAASTAFWSGLFTGAAFTAVAAALSPLLASAIGRPEAAAYVPLVALSIPLGLVTGVLQSLHRRRLQYRVAYTGDIVAAAGTAVLPVAFLLAGWGPLGVILGRLGGALIGVAALFLVGRWWPRWTFDRTYARATRGMNSTYLANSVVQYGSKNLDYWVLGATVPAAAFGAYYVAFVIPTLLRQRVTQMGTDIATPLLVKARDDSAKVKEAYRTASLMVAGLVVPVLVGLSITAHLIVPLAFGDRWGDAVAPLRILAIAAVFDAFSVSGNTVFLALRQFGSALRRGLFRLAALAVGLLPVFWFPSITTAAWGVVVGSAVGALVSQFAVASALNCSLRSSLGGFVAPVGATLVMAGAVLGSGAAVGELSDWAELGFSVLVGAAVYLATLRLVFRRDWRALMGFVATVVGRPSSEGGGA